MSYAICLKCRTPLKSETVHEFSMCKCDNQSFIDGGNEYLRCGGMDMDAILMLDKDAYRALSRSRSRSVELLCDAALKGIKQAREQAYRSSGNAGRMNVASIPLTFPSGAGL